VPIIPILNAVLPTTGIKSYLFKRSENHIHRGIDLPADIGTRVLAAADGIVRTANFEWHQGFTGYGRVVVIEHAHKVWTLYAHLTDVLVDLGQHVKAGSVIGTVGITQFLGPEHTSMLAENASHLHFEVSPRAYPQDAEASRMDPVKWLKRPPAMELLSALGRRIVRPFPWSRVA
jgi:murein DD-endopeptidase MepM/ murein hydrolase activator NlpD